MDTDPIPSLVDALRRLRRLSYRDLALSAGISSPSNLREWVQGLPSRLSAQRAGRVLESAGLDLNTRELRPGLHRWSVGEDTLPLVAGLLPLLFPDSLRYVWGCSRASSPLCQASWLLLARHSSRVLVDLSGAPGPEREALSGLLEKRAGMPVPMKSGQTVTLSSEDLSRLADPDLEPETLDRIFALSFPESSVWTYERLFERLWADGIDPAEAARRLGFL